MEKRNLIPSHLSIYSPPIFHSNREYATPFTPQGGKTHVGRAFRTHSVHSIDHYYSKPIQILGPIPKSLSDLKDSSEFVLCPNCGKHVFTKVESQTERSISRVVVVLMQQIRLFTDDPGTPEDLLQDSPPETAHTNRPATPNPSQADPKLLVRNYVKLRNGSFRYPTSSMVHLLGRVLTAVKTMELPRGRSRESYNCFYLLTGHFFPDGTGCTQKHRVIVPQSSSLAYNNSSLMKRDNIVQISGDISYRFYFEPQIQMYVPYTEFIATQLRFFRNPMSRQDRVNETETGTETGTETEPERDVDREVLDAMEEGKDFSGYEDK